MTGDFHVRPRRYERFQRYLSPLKCLRHLALKKAQKEFAYHVADFFQNIVDIKKLFLINPSAIYMLRWNAR